MKVKYNRVKANSCKDIIKYVSKGYSPFVIDCSGIEDFYKTWNYFYLKDARTFEEHRRRRHGSKYGQLLDNYFHMSKKEGFYFNYCSDSVIRKRKYKICPNGYFLKAMQYYSSEDVYEYMVRCFYEELLNGSNLNDPECMYVLGKLLFKGIHFQENKSEGIKLLKKASKVHPGAKDFLGKLYLEGKDVKKNVSLGNKLIEESKKYDYYDFFKENPHYLDFCENEYCLSSEVQEFKEILTKIKSLKPFKKVYLRTYQDCLKYVINKAPNNIRVSIDYKKSKKLFAYLKKNQNKDDNHKYLYVHLLSSGYFDEFDEKEVFNQILYFYKKGYIAAINSLALDYYYGNGCEVDHNKAFELFKEGEEKGIAICISNLAAIYQNPNNIEYDEEKYKECCLKLLDLNSFFAFYRIFNGYYKGIGFKKDLPNVNDLLRFGEKLNDEDAYFCKIIHRENEYIQKRVLAPKEHQIVSMYKKMCKKYRSSKALLNLGYFYKRNKKYTKALKTFEKAAKMGNRQANTQIAVMYSFGLGVDINHDKEIEYYLKGGDNKGIIYNNLGVKYEKGEGVEKNLEKAFEFYNKALPYKVDKPYMNLAKCYFNGIGTPVDFNKGHEILQEGLKLNMGSSYVQMAEIYKEGKYGIEKDKDKYIECINKAIELKYYDAYIDKAYMYVNGTYTKNGDEFSRYIKLAHEKNVNNLDYYYGQIYLYGYGKQINYKTAISYFNKAIEKEYSVAASLNNIGVCYHELKDYENAFKYYQKAIDQNYNIAYYNLASMYYNGTHVDKDLVKAKELYTKAYELGYEKSKKMIELIEKEK